MDDTSIYITDLQIIFQHEVFTDPSFKSMQNFGFQIKHELILNCKVHVLKFVIKNNSINLKNSSLAWTEIIAKNLPICIQFHGRLGWFEHNSMFILYFKRHMESFVKTELKTVGKKKRKLQNEEYSESSSSGVQVNRNIFIMLSLNEHCCNSSVHPLASVTQTCLRTGTPPHPTFRP